MYKRTICLWGTVLLLSQSVAFGNEGKLALHDLFADNAVLQRDREIPIWGTAAPGKEICVSLNGITATAMTGKNGKWMAKLPAFPAGGPYELIVSTLGEKPVTLSNIMLGDVWLCSGQSNMGFPVKSAKNAEQEMAAANYPNLRLFSVALATGSEPIYNLKGEWRVCSPESVRWFSAVGYFFGRDLQKAINVPIGLINASKGATSAEAWTPNRVLAGDPDFRPTLDRFAKALDVFPEEQKQYKQNLANWQKAKRKKDRNPSAPDPGRMPEPPMSKDHYKAPSRLYNAMIHPMIPYGIKGAIWYQGEANASLWRGFIYRKLLGKMISSWREDFGQGDFPFLIVQLANYNGAKEQPSGSSWAELRESQALCCNDLPKLGLAVAIDVGEAKNIHPQDKQTVGARLSLAARAIAYEEKIIHSGPVYKSMRIEGDSIRLSFDHVGGGLVMRGGELQTFAIAGEDKKFIWATARIEGSDVVVRSDAIKNPVAARYAWADNPEGCNLYNAESLPAVPFRTDSWPGVTYKNR